MSIGIAVYTLADAVTATGVLQPQRLDDPNQFTQPFGAAELTRVWLQADGAMTITIRVGPTADLANDQPAVVTTIVFSVAGEDLFDIVGPCPYFDVNVTVNAGADDFDCKAWGIEAT